jgi:UDP-glucose 4-epimerase
MRICVIGGSGFIGINLCMRLLNMHHDVTVLDMRVSPELKEFDSENRIRWFNGNYDDRDILSHALKGCDVLFHLASSTIPSSSNEDPVFDIESNLVTSVRLIEAAKDANVSKIIFVSSGGTVYGIPQYTPIDELHGLNPICSYGISKLAIEKYLAMYSYIGGADYEIFRLSNPYGPYQNPASLQGVIPVFIKKVLSDEVLTIWGDGEVVRDFIYIDDVIDIFIRSLDKGKSNKVYNLGSGVGTSINEVLKSIVKVCAKEPDVRYESSRSIDVPENVLDTALIREVYDWQPKISLEAGLAKTMEYIKKHIQ